MERPHQTYQDYLASLTEADRDWMITIIETIRKNIDPIFEFGMQYKMPSFYIPLTYFPEGYHVSKDTPLPFIAVAKQKHHLSFYHLGVYSNKDVYEWFVKTYLELTGKEVDMGKSCIRVKTPNALPLSLVAELVKKISAEQWIHFYKNSLINR
jgi:hypothetical protein